jgi:hypothetical protein
MKRVQGALLIMVAITVAAHVFLHAEWGRRMRERFEAAEQRQLAFEQRVSEDLQKLADIREQALNQVMHSATQAESLGKTAQALADMAQGLRQPAPPAKASEREAERPKEFFDLSIEDFKAKFAAHKTGDATLLLADKLTDPGNKWPKTEDLITSLEIAKDMKLGVEARKDFQRLSDAYRAFAQAAGFRFVASCGLVELEKISSGEAQPLPSDGKEVMDPPGTFASSTFRGRIIYFSKTEDSELYRLCLAKQAAPLVAAEAFESFFEERR